MKLINKLESNSKRGGKRNFNNKSTLHIEERKIKDLISATNIAFEKNISFNYFVTINFGNIDTHKNKEEYSKCLSSFHALISRFYRHKNNEATYIYVRENTSHEHAHYLFYIHPEDIKSFKKHIKKSILKTFGKPKSKDINFTKITGSDNIKSCPDFYKANLIKLLAYVFKCADLEVALKLGIHAHIKKLVHDNHIVGKRTGYSKNISPKNNLIRNAFICDLKAENIFPYLNSQNYDFGINYQVSDDLGIGLDGDWFDKALKQPISRQKVDLVEQNNNEFEAWFDDIFETDDKPLNKAILQSV